MSSNTPFLIGVIRSQEKELLADDEYTRLINAPSAQEALHVLTETPYGRWLEEAIDTPAAMAALGHRLAEAKAWLLEQLESASARLFIEARSTSLAAAAAALDDDEAAPTAVWQEAGDQLATQLTAAAETPLQRQVAQLTADRARFDTQLRATQPPADLAETVRQLEAAGYAGFTLDMLEALTAQRDATAYEKQWDEVLLTLLRQHAADVVGDDAVLAYWYVLELEVKQLRLLLSAKLQGVETDQLAGLKRSLFRERV